MQYRWAAVLLAAAVLLVRTGAGAIIMSGTPVQKSGVATCGCVTISTNKLEKLCSQSSKVKLDEIDVIVLADAVEEFDLRLCTLDAIQNECELEFTSETDIIDDVEKAADFRKK